MRFLNNDECRNARDRNTGMSAYGKLSFEAAVTELLKEISQTSNGASANALAKVISGR